MNAAQLKPYDGKNQIAVDPDHSAILLDGPNFRVFRVLGDERSLLEPFEASEWQVIPLAGNASVRGKKISAGECGICGKLDDIDLSGNESSIIACNMK